MTDYRQLSDYALLDRFKQGDTLAYEEIYHRYWALLFNHGRRILQDDEDAKDLVQDAFAVLWKEGKTLVIKTSLSAYLYAVVRYKVFDLIDRQKVKNGYLESLEHFIAENNYSSDHLVREKQLEVIIEKEIAALPPRMRLVFELSRKSHLTHKEIAEQLGTSEQTIKKQMTNTLRVLRVKLGLFVYVFFLFHR